MHIHKTRHLKPSAVNSDVGRAATGAAVITAGSVGHTPSASSAALQAAFRQCTDPSCMLGYGKPCLI